ncbi:Cascade antiviral complex protein [Cutibacterium granulosum]|uniref:CRISPR-associated protein CasA n=2 Tax=Cutibacterium granulosum TaxID=33011 RepID=A0A9X5LVB2_9ACTN|nr:type I-E CRISPR-associated protein Cse1/CasA [Cutibacterium granulosum]KAG9060526.1 type I-E CRISPR-associated protein Cse1/CasA [Cutibacterium granulosum DSM 20700]SNV34648.1 Cascade antiviral complex protein [Cutibacterium granulosum]
MTSAFNLVDEPWISVRTPDNDVTEVSIRDAFHRGTEFRGLAGEIPTQEAAILRLLLAIAIRATARFRSDDEKVDDWGEWWQSGLPLDEIDTYLDRWHDKFNLVDNKTPFMQVADLRTAKGGYSGLTKIISEVPANDRFFTTRDGAGTSSLDFAEAARWLIHAHAFDVSGIKSGAIGDPRVKGGRGYPIGTGISGPMGIVIVEGASLAETLLLNLFLENDPQDDLPVWERPPQVAAPDREHPVPTGCADLFTWQSRRARLITDGNRVVDVLLCNGDKVEWKYLLHNDSMTAWRFSAPQTKAAGETVYMPRSHDSTKAMWRGLEPLLVREPAPDDRRRRKAGEPDDLWLRPEIFEQLATLSSDGALPGDHVTRIRTIGMEYGSQSSMVTTTIDDAMPASVAVITDEQLGRLAVDSARTADSLVFALQNLATDLAAATGSESEGIRPRASEMGYAALDPAYREWFSLLSTATDIGAATLSWRRRARQVMHTVGEQLCRDAGPAALTGRMVPVPNTAREDLMDLARAWQRFAARLRTSAPLPEDPQRETKTSRKEQ